MWSYLKTALPKQNCYQNPIIKKSDQSTLSLPQESTSSCHHAHLSLWFQLSDMSLQSQQVLSNHLEQQHFFFDFGLSKQKALQDNVDVHFKLA